MKPLEIYNQRVADGTLNADPDQLSILSALQGLAEEIEGYKPKSKWLLSGVFGVVAPRPRGLYIYGGVGRGKSMLMDLFFDASPIKRKRRVHFHSFMQEVHDGMHHARASGVEDAIRPVAEKIIKDASLLCFDEMQITDITDAMIVGRLFEFLFDSGVIIVTTSNRHPDDLYKNGLNRNLFVPFIEQIKTYLTVHNLDSETDHRQNRLSQKQTYFTPLNDANHAALMALWDQIAGSEVTSLTLHQKNREITLPHHSGGVAMAGFDDLCARPLGPGDYLLIAKSLRALFITNVPILTRARNNEAKRFVTLIDALYEAKVRVILSADAQPEQLYETGAGAFEFERTASRLREMQGDDWGA
ncbi:cell division protein ZapE [Amylibacter marinus]|uniref:Cell division protein ZapE n=1 Tax=Amylibacter marinus TaxID=1475483 RepID=A0ABQ5VWZ1_9RHOB|nr:cell division protein ZapE [Amylibacter marinus]GLQ35717.1 cell division protein ZapE [Amylibacter marinus]